MRHLTAVRMTTPNASYTAARAGLVGASGLGAACLVASLIPARRAAKIAPSIALREVDG